MKKINNWYVITGAVSSGKTTIINLLEKNGYKVVHETATEIIEAELEKGRTLEEIRSDDAWLQKQILQSKIDNEAGLNPHDIVFLDRGVPDSIAYYKNADLPLDNFLKTAVENASYKKIFIFDRLPLTHSHYRQDAEETAKNEDEIHREVYKNLPFPITNVPVFPINERYQFILDNL